MLLIGFLCRKERRVKIRGAVGIASCCARPKKMTQERPSVAGELISQHKTLHSDPLAK